MAFIGLIGCGYWGKNLIRDFYNTGALHTICDKDIKLLQKFKIKYPSVAITTDWKIILNDTKITAICVSLPAELHYTYVKAALMKKKDIFVEKPLSLNLDDGNKLVKLAKDNNNILMVGHLLHYHPAIKKIFELVNNNKIGQIRYITSNRLNLGKIRQEENVLWSFAPHDISVILRLMGAMPQNIMCSGQSFISKTIYDITTMILEFPGKSYSQINVNWLNPFKEQKMTIVGKKGMIIFDDMNEPDKKIKYFSEYIKWDSKTGIPLVQKSSYTYINYDKTNSPLENECLYFINCCKTRNIPITDGEEGLRVLKVLDLAQKSLTQNNIKLSTNIKYYSHKTAIINNNAKIGNNTKIWHYSHIMNCKIGSNCSIGQNCFVANDVIIGDNCKIQNNVSLYSGVIIGNNCFIGPSAVFTNDMNPRAKYSKNGKYMKTILEDGVTIGANATIICNTILKKNCFVGAGAVVTKNVEENTVVVGNPAKQISKMDKVGNKIN